MNICDVMTRNVQAIRDDATVRELQATIAERGIWGMPVLSPDGALVGVVSSTDLVRHYYEGGTDFGGAEQVEEMAVWEIMTRKVLAVQQDEEVRAVAQRMYSERVHRLLVLDGDELVGIVTTMDIVKVAAEYLPGSSKPAA